MIDFIKITNELFKNSFVNELTVEVVSLRLLLAVVFGGIVDIHVKKIINL